MSEKRIQEQIADLEEAIAAQASLRGAVDEAIIEATLAGLRASVRSLKAQLEGSGAIAQEGGTAVGERGVNLQNSTARDIHTGDTYVLPPADDSAGRAARRYLKGLIRACRTLPLEYMGGAEDVGKSVSLDQVYVALDTRRRVPPGDGETGERRRRPRPDAPDEKTRPLTALEAATQERRLVLLGAPGSGKSTFLKQLAAWLARAWLGEKEPPPGWRPLFPLLVTLRALARRLQGLTLSDDAQTRRRQLLDAVRGQWRAELARYQGDDAASELADWLDAGRALLLFDGLDEVGAAQRARVREAVKAVCWAYDLPLLVTCRVNSYTGPAVLPGLAAETLAEFDEEKIKQFVAAWYGAHVALGRLTSEEAADKIADLQGAATGRALIELAANPMLLTVMAIIHRENVGLPKQRVKLYSRAVGVLLTRWQKGKGLDLSPALAALLEEERRLRLILERLAYEAHKRQEAAGSDVHLARAEIIAILEQPAYLGDLGLAGQFLAYVDRRAGLLTGQGGGEAGQPPATYAFPHRTFQEYLAGCYMVSGRSPERNFWPHMESGDYWYLAAELGSEELLYNNPQGQPLFLDLAYALCPAAPPRRAAEWRGVVWSGRMATLLPRATIAADDKPDGGEAYLARLIPRLAAALGAPGLERGERAAAGRSLARLGDPRPAIMEVDAMPFCYVPPGPFLMGSSEDDPAADDEEKPQHELEIPYGYWLAQYPVSNAQFAAFVADGGYKNPDFWPEAKAHGYWEDGWFKGDWDSEKRDRPYDFGEPFTLANHPVVGVSWYEAAAFARWLTARRGDDLPPGWAIRLPSEAEWEKGAKGGLDLPSSLIASPLPGIEEWTPPLTLAANEQPDRRYPWGATPPDPDRANYKAAGIGTTGALGCFPGNVSPYGAREMAGNVWEWTRSRDKAYPYDPADGRERIESGRDWVRLRGGSYLNGAASLRPAARYWNFLNGWFDHGGFRLAASPFTDDR